MRDYGKVHSTFWSSGTIGALSDDGRMLALYLMTCPHATIAGVFRLPDGYACEDLKWSPERVRKGFAELFDNGFANRCETTKWVWIRKHLVWNPPENPNQRKAVAKIADSIPDECSWKAEFTGVSGDSRDPEQAKNGNPSGTLAKPFLNQEQEQEQEQEKEHESPNGDSSPSAGADGPPKRADPIPYQAIVDVFNRTLTRLPKARVITPKRRTLIRSAWQAAPERRSIEFWEALAAEYEADDFTNGTGPYLNGHEGWRPTIDYLLRADVVTRTFERAMDRLERGA